MPRVRVGLGLRFDACARVDRLVGCRARHHAQGGDDGADTAGMASGDLLPEHVLLFITDNGPRIANLRVFEQYEYEGRTYDDLRIRVVSETRPEEYEVWGRLVGASTFGRETRDDAPGPT